MSLRKVPLKFYQISRVLALSSFQCFVQVTPLKHPHRLDREVKPWPIQLEDLKGEFLSQILGLRCTSRGRRARSDENH
jgi:hypothetical protein